MRLFLTVFTAVIFIAKASCQAYREPVAINLDYNSDFTGFELFQMDTRRAFIIAEDVHNRKLAHAATLKFLQYLHTQNNIQTLCIEAGASTAFLINRFLQREDTVLLREIIRHTFYWSKEHHEFLLHLAKWNKSLPTDKKITVQSADIEIKQESVILALYVLLDGKVIPDNLSKLETFRKIFKEKEDHRNRFNALNVRFYYDRNTCSNLAEAVAADLEVNREAYKDFFQEHFDLFCTMMTDLKSFYTFNYRADSKFKFRDDIIYQKLLNLAADYPHGFVYIVGAKHTRPGSSSYRLSHDPTSPFKDQVITMNLSGRNKNGRYLGAQAMNKIARKYDVFSSGKHVLLRNYENNQQLNNNLFGYTLVFSNNEHVVPFPNSYTGK